MSYSTPGAGISEPAWSHRPGVPVAAFARTPWGHRGYEETPVDNYVERVAREQAAATEQISDLRAEVDRLHRYIRRQWAAVAAAESAGRRAEAHLFDDGGLVSPAAQARAVLSQAQEIAERRLAEADARLAEAREQADARLTEARQEATDRVEDADRQVRLALADAERQASRLIAVGDGEAAQRLTRVDALAEQVLVTARQDADGRRARAQDDAEQVLLLARNRYEDIVVRAHQRADRAAEVALDEFEHPRTEPAGGGRLRAELEMKAAYLRTFAKASRAALQAALDVTAREFDRLLAGSASREVDFGPALVLEQAPARPGPDRPWPPRPRVIVLPDTEAARSEAARSEAARSEAARCEAARCEAAAPTWVRPMVR